MAAPDWPALREGARRPPRPVLTGPPGPVHPAPGLLRAAAAEEEASKPLGPWPGRGEGEAPRGARAREPSHPHGGAVGRGQRAWRGRCGEGAAGSGARRGLGLSPGRSRLPGVGWWGRPGPQRRSTNRPRTRSRQEAREGGRDEGGAGPPGNPSLSGPRGSLRGRGQPSDPPPPQTGPLGPPPSRPFRDPGPRTPWGPGKGRGTRGLRPQPLASGGQNRPAPPHFREGAEAGSRNRPFARGRGFPSGAKPKHPELGLAEDPAGGLLRLWREDAQGIGVRVALAQLKPGRADAASCRGQPQPLTALLSLGQRWEMAPVLPLVLPLQPRIRLAQGLWLLSWLLVLVGGLTLLCSGHLLVQLWHLGTFLAPSCPFSALPQVALAASAVALGTGLVSSGASRASLDAEQYPPWRGVLGPLLVAGTAGGGGLLVLALGLALSLPGTLDTSLEEGLGSALAHYKDTEVPGRCQAKRLLDELQLRYHCCGRHGYKDWFGIQWVSNRYLDPNDHDVVDRIQSNVEGLYLIDGVPFSCCNPHSPRPCLQSQLSDPHAHPLFDPRQPNLNLWSQGCHEVLLGHLQGLASTLGNTLAVTFLLQTLVLLGLRYLQTALEGLGGVIDGEGEAQGYLFPAGLKDMLKTAWLQGAGPHRPAPGEAPPEEEPPKEGLP